MFRVAAVAGAAVLVCAGVASASWVYQGEKSAFGGAGTHLVLTFNSGYGFGFRCDDDGAKTVFITPETASNADMAQSVVLGTLLVRVDSGEVRNADAVPDSAANHLRLTAQYGPEILPEVRNAKRKVSVAVKVGSKILHETSFPAKGVKDALAKFINACPAAESVRG